jgi:hypothetical protein
MGIEAAQLLHLVNILVRNIVEYDWRLTLHYSNLVFAVSSVLKKCGKLSG